MQLQAQSRACGEHHPAACTAKSWTLCFVRAKHRPMITTQTLAGPVRQLHVCQAQHQHRQPLRAGKGNETMLTAPMSLYDVDQELWRLLDLCQDEELENVYNVLFGSSPFSPLLKSMVREQEPALVELRGRTSVMHKVESRFRFLAAGSGDVLRGRRPSYRDTLVDVRDRLDISCPANLSTQDLETEIFVHVLQHCREYVQGQDDPDPSEAAAMAYVNEGDGMASSEGQQAQRPTNWTERLTAPFKFGLQDLVPTLAKLGSALTVSTLGGRTAQTLGAELVSQHMRYQAAMRAVTGAARSLAGVQKQAALHVAQKGLTAATARYSAVRGAMSLLGPAMWGWLAVDLALKSVGTDYARVIRAVFILAQIRLVRTAGFQEPASEDDDPSSIYMV